MILLNYPELTRIQNNNIPLLLQGSKINYKYLLYQCRERNSSYFINKSLGIIILSCIGQYTVYDLSTYELITKTSIFQIIDDIILDYENRRSSRMIFLTDDIFIDYFTNIIVIFKYDKNSKTLTYIGRYKNDYTIKQISSYEIIKT